MKYLDENGLLYVIQKIKTWLNGKVDKVEGKGLSTNDFTNELKIKYDTTATKVDEITESGGAPNIIEIIKVNGSALNPDSNKAVNITVPTNNNQLENGAGYQTESEVTTAITNALKDVQGIKYQIEENLPSTGEAGTIYLISNSGTGTNIYDEYIWVNNKFEKIGTTAVDLTNYIQSTDLVAITNEEVDTICAN